MPNLLDRSSGSSGKGESVLVIGAGIAGLAAADALKKKGFSVTVIEGRERIGGRIWTDRSWSDCPVELGASWIHGIEGNPIAKLVRSFKIQTTSTNYYAPPLIYSESGELLAEAERQSSVTHLNILLSKLYHFRERLDKDMSLGDALEQAIPKQKLSKKEQFILMHVLHTVIEQDYATDASELSLWYWDDCDEFSGEHAIFPGGYDQVVHKLAKGLDIRLGHVVQQIQYGQRVRLTTTQGTFEADRAIVTLPLGVLKAGSVVFSPALPKQKQSAIYNLRMGVLNKLLLRFPQCFWPEDSEWLEIMGKKTGGWVEFFNDFKYSGKPILLGFCAGSSGRTMEQRSDLEIVKSVMDVLHDIFGNSIPEPEAWKVTRWASDPYAYGSYAYIPPGASSVDCNVLAEPVGDRLFFAGEATLRTAYGTVHGAFLSGILAARMLVEPESVALVASRNSKIYHFSPDCLDAQTISPENRILGPLARSGRSCHVGCPRKVG